MSSSGTSSSSLASNIITGNSADLGYAGGVATTGSGNLQITRNTVFGNTTTQTGGTGGFACAAPGTGYCIIVDNIFWNNSNIGLYLVGSGNVMSFNDFGTLGGDPPIENYMSLSVNPKFADSAAEDFHLASDSPLIGATTNGLGLLTDPEGHTYATGISDIGTFAETIFSDGFGN
jgi:parallel beta-helix repeat protein